MKTSNFARAGYVGGIILILLGIYRAFIMQIEWDGLILFILGCCVIGVAFNWNKLRSIDYKFTENFEKLKEDVDYVEEVTDAFPEVVEK